LAVEVIETVYGLLHRPAEMVIKLLGCEREWLFNGTLAVIENYPTDRLTDL